MTLEDIRKFKNEILKIASRRGVFNIRVFGSVATGRAGPGSDVDFLVEMERERSLLDFAGFCIDLRELLGCRVDVVEKGGESPYMSKKILSEAVPL